MDHLLRNWKSESDFIWIKDDLARQIREEDKQKFGCTKISLWDQVPTFYGCKNSFTYSWNVLFCSFSDSEQVHDDGIGTSDDETNSNSSSTKEDGENSPNMGQPRRVIKLDLAAMSQLLAFDEVRKFIIFPFMCSKILQDQNA